MKDFTHFLLTRFNVLLPGHEKRDREWLEHRFDIFERFCRPSVERQSCRNFHWLVFFDSELPEEYRRRVKGFVPIYVQGLFTQSVVQMALAGLVGDVAHLITSRLDCDDAIATRYIEAVQDQFRDQDFEFVNFTDGFVLNGEAAYSLSYPSNPFISLIERTEGFQSVYCGNHFLLANRGPIRQIARTPGWLQVVHDRNIRNRVRGKPVATGEWARYFSIYPDCNGAGVSCIMATKNRPEFFRIALECFRRQTYSNAELIVVDDGEISVEGQCAGVERVRCIRLNEPTLLGTKLNLGIAEAKFNLIQKLDDDDYYGPEFLRTAVTHLTQAAPGGIVAWTRFFVLRAGETMLRDSGAGWKAGGTLCFARSLWERKPFRDLPKSVDSVFLRDQGAPVIPVSAPEQYVLVRHGSNTWTLMQGGLDTDEFLGTLPVSKRALSEVVHPSAAAFYTTRW